MNKVQYKRWKDFSLRMARKGWSAREIMRREHQRSVIPAVKDFFDSMEWDYKKDVIRIESWDHTRPNGKEHDVWKKYGPYVSDIVTEMVDHSYNPFYWDDEASDKAYKAWDELWAGRIRCCIRAGLDLAVNPIGGVLGFTKSDIERMYPEGAPKWIKCGWYRIPEEAEEAWDKISSDDNLWI